MQNSASKIKVDKLQCVAVDVCVAAFGVYVCVAVF